MITSYHNK